MLKLASFAQLSFTDELGLYFTVYRKLYTSLTYFSRGVKSSIESDYVIRVSISQHSLEDKN